MKNFHHQDLFRFLSKIAMESDALALGPPALSILLYFRNYVPLFAIAFENGRFLFNLRDELRELLLNLMLTSP